MSNIFSLFHEFVIFKSKYLHDFFVVEYFYISSFIIDKRSSIFNLVKVYKILHAILLARLFSCFECILSWFINQLVMN